MDRDGTEIDAITIFTGKHCRNIRTVRPREMSNQPSGAEIMSAIIDLHGAIAAGFERVDKRFADVDPRFEALEGGLGVVETRMTGVEGLDGARRHAFRSHRFPFGSTRRRKR